MSNGLLSLNSYRIRIGHLERKKWSWLASYPESQLGEQQPRCDQKNVLEEVIQHNINIYVKGQL